MGKDQKRSESRRHLSAAVLAGGASSRMGTDKALIEFDGKPLASHVAEKLAAISDDVFVVSKDPLALEVPEVLDGFEDATPLSGVITALHAAQHPLVFVCACDMPFASPDLAEQLAAACTKDAAVPKHAGQLEPLHGVWSVAALPKIEAIWEDGERAVHRALERLDVEIVDVADARPFKNVNTPADLDALSPRSHEGSNDRRSGS